MEVLLGGQQAEAEVLRNQYLGSFIQQNRRPLFYYDFHCL